MVDWIKCVPFVGTAVCAAETAGAIVRGNGKQAFFKLAETALSVAMDGVTIATAGAGGLATFSAKSAGKVAASVAIKNVAGATLVRGVGTTLMDQAATATSSSGMSGNHNNNSGGSSSTQSGSGSSGGTSTNTSSGSSSNSAASDASSNGGDDERPNRKPSKSDHNDDEEFEGMDESSDESLLKHYRLEMERRVQDADVQELINRPLTADDGRGTIYIYGERTGSTTQSSYKIGMTKCDPRRRINTQENQNDSDYKEMYYHSGYWRRRAERVVHLMLQRYRSRRNIAGGTEWFDGPIELFIEAVRVAEKWVNKKWKRKQ